MGKSTFVVYVFLLRNSCVHVQCFCVVVYGQITFEGYQAICGEMLTYLLLGA